MFDTASALSRPISFARAENEYSIWTTSEIATLLAGSDREMRHRVYLPFSPTRDERHLLRSTAGRSAAAMCGTSWIVNCRGTGE